VKRAVAFAFIASGWGIVGGPSVPVGADVRGPIPRTHPAPFYEARSFAEARSLAGPPEPAFGARAVIVPHHWLAGRIIVDGLRDLAAAGRPARIVLIGPNHIGAGGAPVITSEEAWATPHGEVRPSLDAVRDLVRKGVAVASGAPLTYEHSIAGLIPAIAAELPGSRIVPLALSAGMKMRHVRRLAAALAPWLDEDTVLVASVDFSHYLGPDETRARDRQTLVALRELDSERIMSFGNEHLDSPASIAVVIEAMRAMRAMHFELRENTNAAEITGRSEGGITSYIYGFYREYRGAAPRRRFTIAATGDILIHSQVARRARANGASAGGHDFAPMFAGVKEVLSSADLSICHMETPIASGGTSFSYGPVFAVPGEIATALAGAGYDSCSTASNHSLDGGMDGVIATLDALDSAGVAHTGTARSGAEKSRTTLITAGGVTVAHLSYTQALNEPGMRGAGRWAVNLIDPAAIIGDARSARAAGAEFVVVSLHWGAEYRASPTEFQRRLAQISLGSPDIDLIIGHHAHVVQAVEAIGSKYVAYGMGNFLSGQSGKCCPLATQDGVILRFVVEEGPGGLRVSNLSHTPTWVEPDTFRILPFTEVLDGSSMTATMRAALTASACRTTRSIGSLGAPEGIGVTTKRAC